MTPRSRLTPERSDHAGPGLWSNARWHVVLLLVLGFGLYANTIPNRYAMDDGVVILRNENTRKGLAGMRGIWTQDTFLPSLGASGDLVSGGRYRPLSVALLALESQFLGTPVTDEEGAPVLDADGHRSYAGNPHASHLVNALLYGILCAVLNVTFLEMLNPRRQAGDLRGNFIALAGALLFAAHPVHTEAVANIKGRDEILVLLGCLLAVLWTLRSVNRPDGAGRRLGLAAAAFVVGIFSKESAVTFLAIIPAALFFFTRAGLRTIALRTAPFVLIAAVFWFGVRAAALGPGSGLGAQGTELLNDPFLKIVNGRYVAFTPSERLGTILVTWLEYLRLLVFPHPLTSDYYPMQIRMSGGVESIPTLGFAKALLSLAVHLALATFAVRGFRKRNPLAFCVIFYAATLSVASNLLFPIGTNLAERFLFAPSVGFCLAAAIGLAALAGIPRRSGKQSRPARLRIAVPVLAGIVLAYSGKTLARNLDWKDDYTLCLADIDTSPYSVRLNRAVAGVLQKHLQGVTDPGEARAIVARSLRHAQTAVDLHPQYTAAWVVLGNAHALLAHFGEAAGDAETAFAHYGEAIGAYQEAERLLPSYPDVRLKLGNAYRDRGRLLGERTDRIDLAVESLERAAEYRPDDYETARLLGVAYDEAGRPADAVRELERALERNPESVATLHHLEATYLRLQEASPAGSESRRTYGAKAREYHARWWAIDSTFAR